jgi:hypothetical protein
VYSLPPKNRANYDPSAFLPQERELVFDIDMDEYNRFTSFYHIFLIIQLNIIVLLPLQLAASEHVVLEQMSANVVGHS